MRALIVPELRKRWPAARIVHELPLRYSTRRIDLAAITETEIISVEIKSSKGTIVVIDPHAILEYGRIDGVLAHLIVSSHLHNDHTQYQVVENFKEKVGKWDKPKLIEGLKRDNGRVTWNIVDEKFKDFRIRTVGTYHDPEHGLSKGLNSVINGL